MRKTSYAVTFLLVLVTLTLNILATNRTDWLIDKGREFLYSRTIVHYGLMTRCERQVIRIPDQSDDGQVLYTAFKCRDFPKSVSDRCDKENRLFCAEWTSAGYSAHIGIGFGGMALFALLIGVSTHSRRRRVWKAVAGLVTLNALFSMIAFIIVTDLFRTSHLPDFAYTRLGPAWYINMLSWVFSFLIVFGVIWTGKAADQGHKWAAGNRAYTRIAE
ncbi:hypothetical protein B0F90DRAFT_1808927 [Multifurca ochricompacta]|uniref:Uncharacterized protein n=1 Tax=Multifurca ochricompacta TaxID=376703 RepID=A0AAD4M9H6_9AGAM|nr:hypothetical protein B0F90DRAFT_1808927 [Multifurca ochricompacta]